MADDLKRMTLVERLKKADYVSRELSEHLRQASLPKLTGLIRACREYDVTAVSDQQILDRIHAVFEADEFADKLFVQLRALLDSIREDVEPMLFSDASSPQLQRPSQEDLHAES